MTQTTDTMVPVGTKIVQQRYDTDPVFGEALRILGHTEFFAPVYNLLHRGNRSPNGLMPGMGSVPDEPLSVTRAWTH
jgi:hypothetical protein